LPFTLGPTLPLEVTAGDRVEVPLRVANNTAEARSVEVALKQHSGLELLSGQQRERLQVPADTPVRRLYTFRPALREGEAVLAFEGKVDRFGADAVRGT